MNKAIKKLMASTYIRTLYSPEFASLGMSFYNTYFALCFAEHIGKDRYGLDQYDIKTALRTTINYEGAAALYIVGMSILDGKYANEPVKLVLTCQNNTTLTLEHKPDENDHGYVYLTIDKNNQSLAFRFETITIKRKENGKTVEKVIHAGLGGFTMTLSGYLTGVNASGHLSKLPENFLEQVANNQNEPITVNISNTNNKTEEW